MTVIAALDCGDCLYLASDSQVTDVTGLKTTVQKLSHLSDQPLAWGFAGDEGIGRKFSEWMADCRWSIGTAWESLADAAIAELSRLNGRKRELGHLARVEPRDEDFANVLIAGCVNGVLDIWELTDRGGVASVKHNGFCAIGSGSGPATIAYITVMRAMSKKPPQRDEQLIAFIVELAAQTATNCGLPIRVLRITRDAVTQVIPVPE
jgi:ATP-dependent protease HslVU (ClpYQ) peptidase subunit